MKKALKYSFLIIITIVFLFPVVYMLACSFMGKAQISTLLNFSNGTYKDLNLIPDRFSFNQYYQVFFRRPEYLLKFWNSIKEGHFKAALIGGKWRISKLSFDLWLDGKE